MNSDCLRKRDNLSGRYSKLIDQRSQGSLQRYRLAVGNKNTDDKKILGLERKAEKQHANRCYKQFHRLVDYNELYSLCTALTKKTLQSKIEAWLHWSIFSSEHTKKSCQKKFFLKILSSEFFEIMFDTWW